MNNHHQEQQTHHEDSHNSPTPIISVADFDGNGEVNAADIEDLIVRSNSSDGDDLYHPLYDLDANGTIDDVDITLANETVGQDIPLLDQQIAQATQATIKYYGSDGLEQAIADGYVPMTTELAGHGIHYFNPVLAEEIGNNRELDIERPIGLNYDAEGNLVAVFYFRQPNTLETTPENPAAAITVDPADDSPPTSFEDISAEDWHNHQNAWFTEVGNLNPEEVYFEEDLPPEVVLGRIEEITSQPIPEDFDQAYSPKFFMLHGWFHSFNPDGTFATTNPELSIYAPEELGAHGGHGNMGHDEEGNINDHSGHSEGHSEDNSDIIVGTDAEDGLYGTHHNDRISVFNDNDWVNGGLGNDSIWGGQGDDWLSGDDENAEGGDDMLYGGTGNDAIYGRVGNDRIFGGTGDDYLVGEAGDDLLRGGLGYDNLIGGDGADKFVLVAGEGTDTIHDFELGEDTVVLYGGLTVEDIAIVQSNSDTILNANDETLALLSGVDSDEFTASSSDVFLVA